MGSDLFNLLSSSSVHFRPQGLIEIECDRKRSNMVLVLLVPSSLSRRTFLTIGTSALSSSFPVSLPNNQNSKYMCFNSPTQ